jgi:hypothetical protein
MAEETQNGAEAPVKESKSIVPRRYAGRYKGDNDALATFIREQCSADNKFSFDKFFDLCRKNGVSEEQVAKYKGAIDAKAHGAQGRTRMTLRNMLATVVRKTGKLTGLDGAEASLTLPKVALTGAAKAAQEKAGAGTA